MLKILHILIPGAVALSLLSDCGKPSASGFDFMREINSNSKLYPGKILVDDADYDRLNCYKWYIIQPGGSKYPNAVKYAVAWVDKKMVRMHRFVMNITDRNINVDHRDRDGLNNQRNNLRIATHTQNMTNRKSQKQSTSKFLGVYWAYRNNKWKAQIRDNGKLVFLGYHVHEINAAKAYDNAAKEIHGEFANLNFNGL